MENNKERKKVRFQHQIKKEGALGDEERKKRNGEKKCGR